MNKITVTKVALEGVSPNTMNVGDIGEVIKLRSSTFGTKYLMRTYGEFVDLENPKNTWGEYSFGKASDVRVNILPAGTLLQIHIKDGV